MSRKAGRVSKGRPAVAAASRTKAVVPGAGLCRPKGPGGARPKAKSLDKPPGTASATMRTIGPRVAPKPVAARVLARPVATRVAPKPVAARVLARPVATRVAPKPGAARGGPAAAPSRVVSKPVAARVVSAPVAARVVPKPVASSALKGVPATGATARAPDSPELRVGDDLPGHGRGPISRVDIARFSAASGAFNLVSLDEPCARAAGLPSVVVPGGFAVGLAGACLSRWLRDEGSVVRLGARCVKMIWPGDQLHARGRVAEMRPTPEGRLLELDVWVENQKGELVLKGQATCLVRASLQPRAGEFFGLPVPPVAASAEGRSTAGRTRPPRP